MCGCCEPLPKEFGEEQAETERVKIEDTKREDARKPEQEPIGVR